MDYINDIGNLGLGSRLKRLSDTIMSEVKVIYRDNGFDFEPKWFPLFSLLNQNDQVTITDAAKALNLTHPFISKIAKEMEKEKLIKTVAHTKDKRSRYLQLTPKGVEYAEELLPLWRDIRRSLDTLFADMEHPILPALSELETTLHSKRLSTHVKEQTTKRENTPVRIRPYSKALAPHFERLNREWLEKYFEVEDIDRKLFSDPHKEIIAKGGDIFFVQVGDDVVGTCALIKAGNGFELARFAITDSVQGQGVGRALAETAIEQAKSKGGHKLFLTTNSKLKPATTLYETLGFKVTRRGPSKSYKRADMVMEMSLIDDDVSQLIEKQDA